MPSPSAFGFDVRQDAQLRNVPVPRGLLQRLRAVALADDEDLDAAIRDVPIPAGLTSRLGQSAWSADGGLEAAIGDVAVPGGLAGRLRQVPKGGIRSPRLTRWAAAASLLIALGVAYFGAMVALLLSAYPYPAPPSRPKLASSATVDLSGRSGRPELDFGAAVSPGSGDPQQGLSAGSRAEASEVELVRLEGPKGRPRTHVGQVFRADGGVDPFLEAGLDHWGVLTAHREFDDLPELKLVAGLIPRGIDWPLVHGSNPHILIRYGVHPFVSPASHPRLRSVVVPLGVDRSSYELTGRYLEDERVPPPDVVRTEEFLAAVDYGFPVPKQQAVGLSVAAGPSPFGDPGLRLIQIGVQARELEAGSHDSQHLVFALDVSASMRWGGRLEMIRRQLSRLVGRLGPEDRISLITFSEEARLVADRAGRNEADELVRVIDSLSAEGSTNVGAGLREAYAVARRTPPPADGATRVVLLTDGLAELTPGTAEKVEQRLAEAARRGVRLEVIDLGQERQPDPQWARFARSGGGRAHRATGGDQLRWTLVEILTGTSQLVARGVRLKITFDPKTVQEYRLLGHEATGMAGLMPAHPESDFHAGQSATAVCELRLRPKGGQHVATVELTWRDPAGGEQHTVTRTVRRKQFGSSFVEAPLALTEAALVAEAAEVLRLSPYALGSRGSRSLALARVLQLADQVDTRLYRRPTFVKFLSLVRQAQKARSHRRGH